MLTSIRTCDQMIRRCILGICRSSCRLGCAAAPRRAYSCGSSVAIRRRHHLETNLWINFCCEIAAGWELLAVLLQQWEMLWENVGSPC